MPPAPLTTPGAGHAAAPKGRPQLKQYSEWGALTYWHRGHATGVVVGSATGPGPASGACSATGPGPASGACSAAGPGSLAAVAMSCPHAPQKRLPAAFAAPQDGQTLSMRRPQLLQNRAPASFV